MIRCPEHVTINADCVTCMERVKQMGFEVLEIRIDGSNTTDCDGCSDDDG
jgi:hypothetical protein